MPKKNWKRLEVDIYTKIVEIPAPAPKHKPKFHEQKPRAPKPISISESDTNWRRDLKPSDTVSSKAEIKDSKPPSKVDSDMNWRKK